MGVIFAFYTYYGINQRKNSTQSIFNYYLLIKDLNHKKDILTSKNKIWLEEQLDIRYKNHQNLFILDNFENAFHDICKSSNNNSNKVDKINFEERILVNFEEEFNSEFKELQICFLIDTTNSMKLFLTSIKKTINQIIRDSLSLVNNDYLLDSRILVSLVIYRDHNDKDYLTKAYNFRNYRKIHELLDFIKIGGGDDEAEAVIDGLNNVNSLSWSQNSNKFLFHFLDGPPHGKNFHNKNTSDNYQKGCPCNLNTEEVLSNIRENNIDYTVIQLSDSIDMMINSYSKHLNIDVIKINFDENYSTEQCKVFNDAENYL